MLGISSLQGGGGGADLLRWWLYKHTYSKSPSNNLQYRNYVLVLTSYYNNIILLNISSVTQLKQTSCDDYAVTPGYTRCSHCTLQPTCVPCPTSTPPVSQSAPRSNTITSCHLPVRWSWKVNFPFMSGRFDWVLCVNFAFVST